MKNGIERICSTLLSVILEHSPHQTWRGQSSRPGPFSVTSKKQGALANQCFAVGRSLRFRCNEYSLACYTAYTPSHLRYYGNTRNCRTRRGPLQVHFASRALLC